MGSLPCRAWLRGGIAPSLGNTCLNLGNFKEHLEIAKEVVNRAGEGTANANLSKENQ